jgi:hypothetical protein
VCGAVLYGMVWYGVVWYRSVGQIPDMTGWFGDRIKLNQIGRIG